MVECLKGLGGIADLSSSIRIIENYLIYVRCA